MPTSSPRPAHLARDGECVDGAGVSEQGPGADARGGVPHSDALVEACRARDVIPDWLPP